MAKVTIMLACAAGMSTSLLVTKMQKAAEDKGLDAEIFAVPAPEAEEIVATKEKLAGLGGQPMHVDTGDADADEYLKGYYKIIFKNSDSAIYKVG